MRVRIEPREDGDPNAEDEIVIRCARNDERARRLEAAVRQCLSEETGISLFREDTEFFLPCKEILFFETDGRKVVAHTADNLYYTKEKLFTLEQTLPRAFVRASKSCIVNAAAVFCIRRGLTGVSEVGFRGTEKTAFLSRSYYKNLMDYLDELRRYSHG